jgi:hypothetical protein
MLLGKTLKQIDRCNHLTRRAGYTAAIVIFSIVTFLPKVSLQIINLRRWHMKSTALARRPWTALTRG